jgi:hypothetical protein
VLTVFIKVFDPCMFKDGMEMYALVINYLDEVWIFKHVIIKLFEINEIINNSIAL